MMPRVSPLIYRDLCALLWDSGDRDAAQNAARHSLALARETGNLNLQAWTLRALATIAADESLTDEVMQEYREVTDLTKRTGKPWRACLVAGHLCGRVKAAR